jgi:hypothetical protein
MSQHDYVIDNGPGKTVRLDIQSALQALASLNAGATAPTVTYPGMMWLDTSVGTNGQLKFRDAANANWIIKLDLDVAGASRDKISSGPAAPTTPQTADIWLNTTTGVVSIYRNSAWTPLAGGAKQGAGLPATGIDGEFHVDTATHQLYLREDGVWKLVPIGDATGNVVLPADLKVTGTADIQKLSGNPVVAGTLAMSSSFMRNRIINGAMVIDQRNAGAAVTVNTNGAFFPVDRFYGQGQNTDGVYTLQQVSDGPSGFTKSLKMTVTTADSSLGATKYYNLNQTIEGLNCTDLNWGSASALTVTLSFWVKSSVTGTYSGSLNNSADNRSYPFTYAISAANTWEYKTVVIPGDTTGTWLTDNGVGIKIFWSFGTGSTYSGTAGAWAGALYVAATGATNIMATNAATWQMTGVQLEVGSVATPFEREIYSNTLAKCQRYYNKFGYGYTSGYCETTTVVGIINTPVSMRATPSVANDTANNVGTVNGTLFNITGTGSISFGDTAMRNNFAIEFPASVSGVQWYTMFVRVPNIQLSAEL